METNNELFLILVSLSFVITVALIIRHKLYYHFRVVEKGALYRSGLLSAIGLRWIRRRYKIKTIVTLVSEMDFDRNNRFQAEVEYCKKNNIDIINIAMRTDSPPSQEQIDSFLKICMDTDRQPVLIHCAQGVIRTNMMVAVYLKNRFGAENNEILSNLPFWGHDINKRPKVKDFIFAYKPDRTCKE